MYHAAFWSVAEPAVAIINCCIATLRPLLKLISPSRLWSSNKGASKDSAGYTGSLSARKPPRPVFGSEHDEHPLTRIENGISTTSITSEMNVKGEVGTTKNWRNDAISSKGSDR